MSAAVVWVSHQEAKVFRLLVDQKPLAEKIEGGSQGHNQNRKQHDVEKFFHTLALRMEGLEEILLIGPGTAKQEFRHYLEKHKAALAK